MSNSAVTTLRFQDFTYTWIVSGLVTNFKEYCKDGIYSPVFIADNINEKYKLCLKFCPASDALLDRFVLDCINHCPSSDTSKMASIIFFFVDGSNKEVFFSKEKLITHTNQQVTVMYHVGPITRLVTNGNLTIKCRIRCCNGLSHAAQTNSNSFFMPRQSMMDDLKNLLLTMNHSDVKLRVNKEIYQVHKSILAARSPVFSAMFQADMREKKENIVEIIDIEPKVMKEVLNFIYTDKVNIDSVPITELLAAADKYQIEGLRIICLEAIVSGLSIDNVVEVIAITDRYEISTLQDYTINFLASNRAEIIAKKNWDEVMKSLPPPMLMKLTTVLMQKV